MALRHLRCFIAVAEDTSFRPCRRAAAYREVTAISINDRMQHHPDAVRTPPAQVPFFMSAIGRNCLSRGLLWVNSVEKVGHGFHGRKVRA
ncbi:hypothetical protein J3D54_003928 [Pseudomonas sp. GGS8]|uniref:hypothetical protein n=1 Tax=Pseudomonas sp. GGS8 TaxID=2817892 RepID=UPI0020A0C208|nr:hypothetical protein [Pseudomonas sp. GGS8]MCP1444796.1 hypothetical protein [Pseudomonas sp. GGS8]